MFFSENLKVGKKDEEKNETEEPEGRKRTWPIVCLFSIIGTMVIAAFYIIMVVMFMPRGGKNKSEDTIVGGGVYGTRSRGTFRGAGGYCFESSMMVWAKNETQKDYEAKNIMVKDLHEGDLISTIDLKYLNFNLIKTWTRATDVELFWGNWKGHEFLFSSGQKIKVTSPHLMIIHKNGSWYFVRADQVKVGDEMKVGKFIEQVIKVDNMMIKSKVAIETEDGTIEVNDVFTSGLCDKSPTARNSVLKTVHCLTDYKLSHFGEYFSSKCMSKIAWKHAYLNNNNISNL